MKKVLKVIAVLVVILLVIFLAVFGLAKMKIILLNKWFVNEQKSTIGVDISHYQGNVDFQKLKEKDIKFVYIKATEGSKHQDDMFQENWDQAAAAGIPSGAYHFFSYDSPGQTQAENFISYVGQDMTGRLVPVVDLEYYGDKEENPPEKEDVVRELKIFLEALETQYGVKPMIYTRVDIYKTYLKGNFDDYKYWISEFYKPISWSYQDDWYIWQYLNRGELEGHEGEFIDLNILNQDKDLEDLMVK